MTKLAVSLLSLQLLFLPLTGNTWVVQKLRRMR